MNDNVEYIDIDAETWKQLIDGQFQDSETGEEMPVMNPATQSVLARIPAGTEADADRAVASAREAFETEWRHTSARERGEYLLEIANRIEDECEAFVELETLENGKTIRESRSDVGEAIKGYRYYAGAADKNHGDTIPEKNGLFDYTIREPYGVVASIIPWNWPPMHTADFTAPQLACGNTVVLKPAPQAPLSSLKMAAIWKDVLPDGVVNVVTGGPEPGIRLTNYSDVDKIAFTGHTTTGTEVMKAAAENITSVMLELGGKNANIVLPDARLDDAVEGAFAGIFTNQGQACASGSRLLLHERIKDDFLEKFIAKVEDITMGPGIEPGIDLAPLTSEDHYEKVTNYVEIGKESDATLFYEGEVPDDLQDGYYVPPVIFTDVTMDMRIGREEIFGPVLSVFTFETVEEALEITNSSEYGLTGAVWSQSMEVANRMARRLDAGIVYVNNYNNGTFLGAPFGGTKKSGIGRKLGFEETLAEFTQEKTIRTAIAGSQEGDLDEFYE